MGVPHSHLDTCPHDESDLHALADGELVGDDDGRRVATLRAQVARCGRCRSRWDAIVGARRLLVAASRDRRDDLPADLAGRLALITAAS